MKCLLCQQPIVMQWQLAQLLTTHALLLPRLCATCLRQFEAIDQAQACPGCGRADSPTLCHDCQRWVQMGETLLHNQAVYTYNAAMKAFIQQYKGLGDWRLHEAFSPQLQLTQRGMVLVPIPTEAKHYAVRGFDPVAGLFGHLPLKHWLHKADTPLPQAKKDRAGRMQTPQSFSLAAEVEFGKVQTICLLDDLYTTGRTLYHAADALRAGGFSGKIISRTLIR